MLDGPKFHAVAVGDELDRAARVGGLQVAKRQSEGGGLDGARGLPEELGTYRDAQRRVKHRCPVGPGSVIRTIAAAPVARPIQPGVLLVTRFPGPFPL